MNVLPLIALFLEQNKGQCRDISRRALVNWIRGREGVKDEDVELAADAMIAAGIGIQQEQNGTVYCRVTYA